MSCCDKKNLSVQNVVEDDGSVTWAIDDVTDHYKQEAKKWRNTRVINRDALKKEVIKRFERFNYYQRLEIRNTNISDEAKRKWIADKKKGRRGIQIDCKDVGPPPQQQDSASASTSGFEAF